jgi:predicted RNase H-like HicB family nuclease
MKDYHINIFYSDEDGGYIADIPDLKNCIAFGETPNDALRELLTAQKLWLEEARNNNLLVPEPQYRPMIYQAVV